MSNLKAGLLVAGRLTYAVIMYMILALGMLLEYLLRKLKLFRRGEYGQ